MDKENITLLRALLNATTRGIPNTYSARRVEEIGVVTYVGYSNLGTLEADSLWTIKKISCNAITTIELGSGAWDDRLTITYR